MSNQVILWAITALPWFILFFMRKEIIRRYMPAALLSTIISVIVFEIGVTLKWWVVLESAYPFRTPSYIYSFNPILTLLLFRFTYGRFWLYLILDIIFNFAIAYLFIGYFLSMRNILQYLSLGPLHVFIITTVTGIVLYLYQIWQERIFAYNFRRT